MMSLKERIVIGVTDHDAPEDPFSILAASDPVEAAAILGELSSHDDPQIRSWVAFVAPRVVGPESASLLRTLALDRDPDVRDEAIDGLNSLGEGLPQGVLSGLRRSLRSSDYLEPMHSMWRLARLRDEASLPDLEYLSSDDSRPPWQQKSAQVAAMLVRNEDKQVISRLRQHDHDYTRFLARAAAIMGTPVAREVVADCAANAPDEECRMWCEESLGQFKTSGGRS